MRVATMMLFHIKQKLHVISGSYI